MGPKATSGTRGRGKKVGTKTAAPLPKYKDLIVEAVVSLAERGGSSRQAIKKFIRDKYAVGAKFDGQFNLAVKRGLEAGELAQPKGPAGSIKLLKKAAQPKPEEAKRAAKPAKRVVKAAKPAKAKPAKAAKAAKPAKPVKAAKAASAVKPAARKLAKPVVKKVGSKKVATKNAVVGKKSVVSSAASKKLLAKKAVPKKTAGRKPLVGKKVVAVSRKPAAKKLAKSA
ncbi:ACR095Wp [Eremothecium gossypii ATCC 10895]|uniref:Histone H1 n=1 Tax=Eremothecium gossypii (strain ATCC 10895 / CBS 109.51 / FGSC 9923 / NRRL Y-1056) TaxID=284811 RepID=H1_EREGS|nr:ACR095Wp [Eremothecium gossypii ATCC 10895]Q75C22.1 RecName: Full=Histone H1 [Eremothecium gossypii ATCC 10895]AAS51321.1 ACR095Wp [Eremothecium gossypii ATCC 10895]